MAPAPSPTPPSCVSVIDLAIRNGLVVTPSGVLEGGVGVKEGRIVSLGPELPPAREEVDAGGMVILPGMVDPHVHLGMGAQPGQGREKFAADVVSESREAAGGGGTTIITTALFGSTRESMLPCLGRAREMGNQNSLVDFKLTSFLLNPNHVKEIPTLLARGVTSFKLLLAYRGEEGRQIGTTGIGWGLVYEAFE